MVTAIGSKVSILALESATLSQLFTLGYLNAPAAAPAGTGLVKPLTTGSVVLLVIKELNLKKVVMSPLFIKSRYHRPKVLLTPIKHLSCTMSWPHARDVLLDIDDNNKKTNDEINRLNIIIQSQTQKLISYKRKVEYVDNHLKRLQRVLSDSGDMLDYDKDDIYKQSSALSVSNEQRRAK